MSDIISAKINCLHGLCVITFRDLIVYMLKAWCRKHKLTIINNDNIFNMNRLRIIVCVHIAHESFHNNFTINNSILDPLATGKTLINIQHNSFSSL